MIKKIDSKLMGQSTDLGKSSIFHFSFADYYDPQNIDYGALRVLNDDIIMPGHGFEMHEHRNMEIITYVIDGKLTHTDSLGHKQTLARDEVQYMCAGSQIRHSEFNYDKNQLRLLQIWIYPSRENLKPKYEKFNPNLDNQHNKMVHIVGDINSAPIHINQDINMFATKQDAGEEIVFNVDEDRQLYLVAIEGKLRINGLMVRSKDGLMANESLKIKCISNSHILIIEMKKS